VNVNKTSITTNDIIEEIAGDDAMKAVTHKKKNKKKKKTLIEQ
jgi:hypothetical protein